MISKKYKGFYPKWYVDKKNKEWIKKSKRYLMVLVLINVLFLPNILLKLDIYNEDKNLIKENENTYKEERHENNNLILKLNYLENLGEDKEFKIEREDIEIYGEPQDIIKIYNSSREFFIVNKIERIESNEKSLYKIKGDIKYD